MDFRFNVNKLLPKEINKITHTLIPEGFRGDRRELLECQRHLTRIVDEAGEASAKAQGLSKPITSAKKLRDTDQIIYLMVDSEGNNGLGSVIGLLKTGSKNLFMFDERGVHFQLQPRCVLDFYIHESRQRMGLGNKLYQHMLAEENLRPIKLAIDRPSEKFLAFLQKYYDLTEVIPQNNKFVVFVGFFDDEIEENVNTNRYSVGSQGHGNESQTSTPNRNYPNSAKSSINSVNGTAAVSRSAFGRYSAARPPCHMASIIHNTAMLGQPTERSGSRSSSAASPKITRPRSLSIYSDDEQKKEDEINSQGPSTPSISDEKPDVEDLEVELNAKLELEIKKAATEEASKETEPDGVENVGSAKSSPSCGQETQQGHLDLKFYHSPLW